jgi:outer membrane immunogenic protein
MKLGNSLTGLAVAGSMLVGAAAASADGMPRYGSIKDAPYVAPFSWTGLYAGIHGGYGWSQNADVTVSDPFTALGPGTGTADPRVFGFNNDANGGIVGGHIGYNWQSGNMVIGAEVDWSWAGIDGSGGTSPIPYPSDIRPGSSVNTGFEISQLGSVRARLGYADPGWLAYLTGGFAWSDVDVSGNMICPATAGACAVPVHAPGSFSDTRLGWVIGGGAEFRLGTTGWIFGAEYLYYRFEGNDGVTVPTLNLNTGVPVTFGTCPAAGTPCVGYSSSDFDIHTVRARLSYKF